MQITYKRRFELKDWNQWWLVSGSSESIFPFEETTT